MSDTLFEVRGALGLVTLNRPHALNALTLGMVDAMDAQLRAWAEDPAIACVAILGAGERAFCAGGDIRALYDSGQAGTPYALDFWAREYRLNALIKRYPKPYVALMNGIAMGGGVGVSVHGSHRIACEGTLFAMPETGIGLFPDVGGSYFLPRLPGQIGMYMALTGARLKAADLSYARVATHVAPLARFGDILQSLADGETPDRALARFAAPSGDAPLAELRACIDANFGAETLDAVLASLETGDDWARGQAATIRGKSPTSSAVAFRQLRTGAALGFEECLRMEFRLCHGFISGHDFFEGVRAAILDKDNAPRWRPASLATLPPAEVDAYFAEAGKRPLPL